MKGFIANRFIKDLTRKVLMKNVFEELTKRNAWIVCKMIIIARKEMATEMKV